MTRARWALIVPAGVGVGAALVALGAGPTIALALVPAVVASLHTRAWIAATWVTLAGLTVWSWGFNNIPLPLGGVSIPLVDAVMGYAIVASFPRWRAITRSTVGRRVLALLVLMSVVAAARLGFDLPRYGVIAGRDALYVAEAWTVLAGYALARALGPIRAMRGVGVVLSVAIAWLLLYPWRDEIVAAGPIVGVQRPTPLFAFTSAGLVGAVALFWFLQDRRRTAVLLTGAAGFLLLMTQGRGPYLAVILSAIVIFVVARRPQAGMGARAGRAVRRLARAGLLVVIVLVLAPPIPGRVGVEIGFTSVAEQLATVFGAEGPGAGSREHRLEAWRNALADVRETPGTTIVGLGYGPDLFGGFTVTGGVDVRKPHNDALEIFARTGLIGFLPWMLLFGTVALWSTRLARRMGNAWWLIALQVTTVVVALTQPLFAFAYGGVVYWVLTGIGIGALEIRQDQADHDAGLIGLRGDRRSHATR